MFLLWLIAFVIGVWGVARMIAGDIAVGLLLIMAAFLIGPGGVSIFS